MNIKNFKLIIFVALLITSCNNGVKQSDYDKLQKELADCKKTIEELQNTPQIRLSKGQQYLANNDYENAKLELNALIEQFSGTDEAKKAQSLFADVEKQEKEKREAEERKKTLGFKALTENLSIKIGDITVKFNSVNTGLQWVFDNYGSEWRYRSAERGELYVLAKIAISSDIKDPKLPPISVYKIKNGSLSLIGTMGYEFSRWKDFGTYLGNNADFGNDFAHTQTISFSLGLSVSKEDFDNNAVFVVVKKNNCFYRNYDRYNNPPVSYRASSVDCDVKSTLTVDDFDNDYVVVKIFNKNKL
ncbi:MAG: hypothetical protein LBT29_03480 [Flavobacteriaceae bacterium]|jgi:hypothetical protein|nr:hypothetical protein [Flavobacteriaceae bacterium]